MLQVLKDGDRVEGKPRFSKEQIEDMFSFRPGGDGIPQHECVSPGYIRAGVRKPISVGGAMHLQKRSGCKP